MITQEITYNVKEFYLGNYVSGKFTNIEDFTDAFYDAFLDSFWVDISLLNIDFSLSFFENDIYTNLLNRNYLPIFPREPCITFEGSYDSLSTIVSAIKIIFDFDLSIEEIDNSDNYYLLLPSEILNFVFTLEGRNIVNYIYSDKDDSCFTFRVQAERGY